jgi:sensor histidine kinase YesM
MERALQAMGVTGPILVVAVCIGLGWVTVKAILQAWTALLSTMQRLITSGIDLHVKEHHSGDEDFREEVRRGFDRIGNEIRAVHSRMDEYLHAEAEAARRRLEDEPAPPPRAARRG